MLDVFVGAPNGERLSVIVEANVNGVGGNINVDVLGRIPSGESASEDD